MATAPVGELKLYNYHEYSFSMTMTAILINILFTLLRANTSIENIYEFELTYISNKR